MHGICTYFSSQKMLQNLLMSYDIEFTLNFFKGGHGNGTSMVLLSSAFYYHNRTQHIVGAIVTYTSQKHDAFRGMVDYVY